MKDHLSDLHYRRSNVSESELADVEQLNVLHDLDEIPTISVLSKAVDQFVPGKFQGSDEIPPDLIKQCQTVVLKPLYELFCYCWAGGEVSQDMKYTTVGTLYRIKGKRIDCNNYRDQGLIYGT